MPSPTADSGTTVAAPINAPTPIRPSPGLVATAVPEPTASLADRIVQQGGQIGVFSPLTDTNGVPADDDSRRNLAKVIQSLENEIAKLKQENDALRQANVHPPTKPKDFASALQNSVDQIQIQLASMLNPISDFAVKEFSLDVNVSIGVDRSGEIEYNFIPLGSTVPADRLTHLTVTLVPLPKRTVRSSWSDSSLNLSRPITDIAGLGDPDLRTLYDSRLYTIGDLLAAGSRLRSTLELAALLKVDRERLANWMTAAELLTVPGISKERAAVLTQCDVTTLALLAQQTAETLSVRLNERIAACGSGATPVTTADCDTWIRTAAACTKAQNRP